MRGLSPFVSHALDLSKPQLISPGTVGIDPTLEEIYGPEPEANWCYYYQKADLARQQGDWDQVYKAGKDAFNLDYTPHNASEYIIYIEAFGRMKEYSQAISYSRIVFERYPALYRMVCSTWQRIETETSPVGDYREDIMDLREYLNCP
jgi:tetratricopeptide (TPR) repeat protein